jgi:hypothetical protein
MINKKILLIFLLIFLFGCQKNLNNDFSNLNIFENDSEILEMISEYEEIKIEKTSSDLIEQDLIDKKISKQDAMILNLVGAFSPELLPKKYIPKGKEIKIDIQQAIDWLNFNYDSLDDETKEMLLPYYVLPDEPNSIFNQPTKTQKISEKISIIPSVTANNDVWNIIPFTINNIKYSVIYRGTNKPVQADWIKKSVQKSHPKFVELLGISPNCDIPIYIVPLNGKTFEGLAGGDLKNGEISRRYILISDKLNEKQTKQVTTHELFHQFQFSIPLFSIYGEDIGWLMEATAVWSENFVYPDLNYEHRFLKKFYHSLDESMIKRGNTHEYSRYTWPLFLEQYLDSPQIVATILLNAKNLGATESATTSLDSFDYLFSEYALWNYNKGPVKNYIDNPEFPGDVFSSKAFFLKKFHNQEKIPREYSIEPLAFAYDAYVFTDEIDKIIFKFNKETTQQQYRWALVKINDEWRIEDWSQIKEKKICKSNYYDDVRAVVIVISNSNLNEKYDESYEINAKGECEPAWKGRTKITWEHSSVKDSVSTTTTKVKGEYISNDELKIDEDGDALIVISNIKYDDYKSIKTSYKSVSCGSLLSNSKEIILKGTTNLDLSDKKKTSLTRWRTLGTIEEPKGIIFDLSVGPNEDWISRTIIDTKEYKSCDSQKNRLDENILEGLTKLLPFEAFEIDEVPIEGIPFEGIKEINISSVEYGEYRLKVEYDYFYG